MKFYLAYGSNLSVLQMLHRCPTAIYVGYGILHNYQLLFRRSYLTIEPKKRGIVPVLVWAINDEDEKSLDRYEGYPRFYTKFDVDIDVMNFATKESIGIVKAMVYAMDSSYPIEPPTKTYYDICAEGYTRFGFDLKHLKKALQLSKNSKS